MYPFASLPANLTAFCGVLRRRHGFRVGPGEIIDAARSLELVQLSDERAVRHVLRPILSGTPREAAIFDHAFRVFFFPNDQPGEPADDLDTPSDEASESGPSDAATKKRRTQREVESDETSGAGDTVGAPIETEVSARDTPAVVARASYSPIAVLGASDAPALAPADAEWRAAARALVQRLHVGLSRRWVPARRGRRFDLRRTLRASLQTGGEPLASRWFTRPRRTPRFVLLIDGSRSMSAYASTALQVAVAMASVSRRVEVFTFSTSLRRVTPEVRAAATGLRRRLESLDYAWGGGTSIGACLQDFVRRFGERLLASETCVIIASDGLDVGDTETLRQVMRDIHLRAAGVVWLNPLLETPGYQPTASGMRAARPYVTTFGSVRSAEQLARLSRMVRVRV
jgi:uncharacterized protein with von Willebrand factor type A (vWA) domain